MTFWMVLANLPNLLRCPRCRFLIEGYYCVHFMYWLTLPISLFLNYSTLCRTTQSFIYFRGSTSAVLGFRRFQFLVVVGVVVLQTQIIWLSFSKWELFSRSLGTVFLTLPTTLSSFVSAQFCFVFWLFRRRRPFRCSACTTALTFRTSALNGVWNFVLECSQFSCFCFDRNSKKRELHCTDVANRIGLNADKQQIRLAVCRAVPVWSDMVRCS